MENYFLIFKTVPSRGKFLVCYNYVCFLAILIAMGANIISVRTDFFILMVALGLISLAATHFYFVHEEKFACLYLLLWYGIQVSRDLPLPFFITYGIPFNVNGVIKYFGKSLAGIGDINLTTLVALFLLLSLIFSKKK